MYSTLPSYRVRDALFDRVPLSLLHLGDLRSTHSQPTPHLFLGSVGPSQQAEACLTHKQEGVHSNPQGDIILLT